MTEPPHQARTDAPVDKVRQGSTPGIARYVLGISLALVIIGFALAWLSA